MTVPGVSIGFPDFSRYSPVSGNLIVDSDISDSFTGAILNVSYYNTIIVSAVCTNETNFYLISFNWFTDSSGSVQIGTTEYCPTPGTVNTFVVPIIAPWCQVTVTHLSGGVIQSWHLSCYGSQNGFSNVASEQAGAPLLHGDRNVGASGNSQFGPGPLAVGPATLSLWHANNNSWLASLHYFDPTALAYNQYMVLNGSEYGQGAVLRISLPPSPVYVLFTNQDTSTRECICAITLG